MRNMIGRRAALGRLGSAAAGGALLGAMAETAAAAPPDQIGSWSSIHPWPDVPIHVHLLPASTPSAALVLTYGREANPATLVESGYTRSYVVNIPKNGAPLTSALLVENTTTNLFCSGHAFLPDGRLVAMGGHEGQDYYGSGAISLFEYGATSRWTLQASALNAGRWYPSLVALPGGEILVVGGYISGSQQPNPLPQVWHPAGGLRNLTGALVAAPSYPKIFALPDGTVGMVGPDPQTLFLDLAGAGKWRTGPSTAAPRRNQGIAVLYDEGQVLIAGGATRQLGAPVATAQVLDVLSGAPAWRTVAPMRFARKHATGTLLPDGTVLVTGGSAAAAFNDAAGAVLAPELWDPATERWTVLASAAMPRIYHSSALLLPDGRVLYGGGGQPAAANWGLNNTNVEIFSPPYLFRGARPRVTAATARAVLGGGITITTPDAVTIAQVTLVRLGSVTHTFNMNQRFHRLSFTPNAMGVVATLSSDRYRLLPGHYLLFALNRAGVPSLGRVVRIDAPA